MFPNIIMSSQLTSHCGNISLPFICCNPLGLGMAKTLPPRSSRATTAGKLNVAAVLLGHMAQVAMDWVKKWVRLWQNLPTTLMKAVLMGIVRGACRVALAAAPFEKRRRFLREQEEFGRSEGKIGDGEKLNVKGSHLEHLLLNSLEELVEGEHPEEGPNWVLSGLSSAEMDKTHMDAGVSKLHLISSSISFDFENDWEDFSEDNTRLEVMGSPGNFSQKWLESYYHPQIFTRSFDIGGCLGGNLKYCCSHHGEFQDVDVDARQRLESPSLSWECKESLASSGDFAMDEDQSFGGLSDLPKGGQPLEAFGNSEVKGSMNSGTSTVSCGFKSPLVLSLFYSPSEDEEQEGEEEEDWWSEDEMEESSRARTSLDGGDSEKGKNSLDVEHDALHQDVLENHYESSFVNNDAFHSPFPPKQIQASTPAPLEPKHQKEIPVSFYLTKSNSKPEDISNPPKHPWPKKDLRAACRYSARKCQLDSKENCDPITTETSPVSQEESQVTKVRFSPVVTIHPLVVWNYASRAARRGPWEEMARDRCRFRRRIAEVGAILKPCLEMEHRAKVWRKIHGVPTFLGIEVGVPLQNLCP